MSGPHRIDAALDTCAREPIHIPGAVQPHGVLLSLRQSDFSILQVSANCADFLEREPAELLGHDFRELLGPRPLAVLEEAVSRGDLESVSPLPISIGDRIFDALFHASGGALIVELEPQTERSENFARHHRLLQRALTDMQAAQSLPALYASVARAVSDLTGFERVLVYRFDPEWHGEVVGEVLTADVDSYMGLHFPATDIPEQARALYAKTWLRIIPTVEYEPAGLEPPLNPLTSAPLDLSFSVLRSVSPIHLEYLRNMNVWASMSISLIVGGRLWGLVACHHRTPRPLPYAVRAACELFGQVASAEIAASERARRLTEHAAAKSIQTRFFDVISEEENPGEALLRYTPSLLEFMGAEGAAIWQDGQARLVGVTPRRTIVAELLKWLIATTDGDTIFATDSLSKDWPPGEECMDMASGLLAVKLSRVDTHWILWFRPQVLKTVEWAGNPEKPMDPGVRLHPRKSFAVWKETVTGRSLPWTENEIEGAQELRLALNALVIRRTERLLQLNAELEKKNSDLNSFAYIASHDLKEPLRGIFHFSRFLREDHADALGEEGLRKVDTIATMASNTNDLLTALARFSQLGRMELSLTETNLEQLLSEVLETLSPMVAEANVEIRRPRQLPTVSCDPALVREVFANLIGNGIKYSDSAQKWVEITYIDPVPEERARGPILVIRDNGIGIRDRNFDAAFQMFRRLNKNKFPDGTGAGLAITKSIVERHGGRIWIESSVGEGSTFLFTLG